MACDRIVMVVSVLVVVLAAVVESHETERESAFKSLHSMSVWTDDDNAALEDMNTRWWRHQFIVLPMADFTLQWTGGGLLMLNSKIMMDNSVDNNSLDNNSMDNNTMDSSGEEPLGPVTLPSTLNPQPREQFRVPITLADKRPSTLPGFVPSKRRRQTERQTERRTERQTERRTERQTERQERRKQERRRQRRAVLRHQHNTTWALELGQLDHNRHSALTKLGPAFGISLTTSSSPPSDLDVLPSMVTVSWDLQGSTGIRPRILPEDLGNRDQQLVMTTLDWPSATLRKALKRTKSSEERRLRKDDMKTDRQRGTDNKRPTGERQNSNTEEERQRSTQSKVVLQFSGRQ